VIPEVFPPYLLVADKWEEVILFIQKLPIPPRRKKQTLVAWCKFVGVALTHEMVELLLGPLEERVRE